MVSTVFPKVKVSVPAYATVLTAAQSSQVFAALGKAIYYAKRSGLMNPQEIQQVDAAQEVLGNIPCVSPFKTQAERDAASLESFAADCARYGCD